MVAFQRITGVVRRFGLGVAMFGVCSLLGTLSTSGSVLTHDRIIYEAQPGVLNPMLLSGRLEMSFNDSTNVLTILLQNTSGNLGNTDDAKQLLSGLGFNLPSSLSPVFSDSAIVKNNAVAGSSIAGSLGNLVNFSDGSLLRTEWGYDYVAGGISGGSHFNNGDAKMQGLSVNTAVGSHKNDMRALGSGSTKGSQTFGGKFQPEASPGFGLLSDAHSAFGSGKEAVEDSITITMELTGTYTGSDLIAEIDASDIVLMFGSADSRRVPPTSTSGAVPEPAAVAVWGVLGLLGYVALRRRTR